MTTADGAMGLLRRANEDHAKGREEAQVVPSEIAHRVGLELGSAQYNDALWYLIDEGALVEGERFSKLRGGEPHGNAVLKITCHGLNVLAR